MLIGIGVDAWRTTRPHSTRAALRADAHRLNAARRIDALRERARDARRAREIVDARRLHAAQAAEMREQRLPLLAADAGDLLQRRRRARLRAPRAMTLDREAMRLVANLLQQMQARSDRAEASSGVVAIRETRSPRARACARAPWRCRSAHVWCSPCSASTSAATPTCPLPPSITSRSGAGYSPRDDARACAATAPRASPRSRRRPTAGVTLKRRYSPLCIASRSKITHDATARSPIVCETSKHSMRCTVDGKPERLLQRGEPILLRRLLREPLADRERRVLARPSSSHTRRSPPGLSTIVTVAPALRRQHLGQRRPCRAPSGTMIVGGTGRST